MERVLTLNEYENLIDSGEDHLHSDALNLLPKEYLNEYKDISSRINELEDKLAEKLKFDCPEIVADFMEYRRLMIKEETIKANAAFAYGTQAEYVNLRIQGWKSPKIKGEII